MGFFNWNLHPDVCCGFFLCYGVGLFLSDFWSRLLVSIVQSLQVRADPRSRWMMKWRGMEEDADQWEASIGDLLTNERPVLTNQITGWRWRAAPWCRPACRPPSRCRRPGRSPRTGRGTVKKLINIYWRRVRVKSRFCSKIEPITVIEEQQEVNL